MRKYNNALVVGKFCPLHKGHQFLLDIALENSNKLMIISYTSRDLGYPAAVREKWLKELYPTAKIIVREGNVPDDDAHEYEHREFCAVICERENFKPDAVFTSEKYGDGFAAHLTRVFKSFVTHEVVDLHRKKFPISGTQLRDDRSLWDEYVNSTVFYD